MWFTENAWPPMLIAALVAVVCLVAWTRTGSVRNLLACVLCIAGVVGIYFAEQSIVTESERIEQLVGELADAVIAGNSDTAVSYISKQSPEIQLAVLGAMKMVTVDDDLSITDTSVDLLAQGSRAEVHFRANGTVSVAAAGFSNHYPSRWRVTWQREAGEWKIIKIARLNIIDGAEIGLLSK